MPVNRNLQQLLTQVEEGLRESGWQSRSRAAGTRDTAETTNTNEQTQQSDSSLTTVTVTPELISPDQYSWQDYNRRLTEEVQRYYTMPYVITTQQTRRMPTIRYDTEGRYEAPNWWSDTNQIYTETPYTVNTTNVEPEVESMPINYAALNSNQTRSLDTTLTNLEQTLSAFNSDAFTYTREEHRIVLTPYAISITPEFDKAPGAVDSRGPDYIRRIKIEFHVPQAHREAGTRYIKYMKFDAYLDYYRLHDKIMEGVRLWGNILVNLGSEAELTEEEVQTEQQKRAARKMKMDELKEKAQQTYERFMELLSSDGKVAIESAKEDEIINVILPNRVKFRLNVQGEQVSIRDVELPVSFTSDKATDFISLLNKFTSI